MRGISLLISLIVLSSCSRYFYVVRHAEKAVTSNSDSMMSADPPLTDKGRQRAETLRIQLSNRNIGHIFSTNTVRTRSTAEPTRAFFNLNVETYPAFPDSSFYTRLKSLKKNTLIVGHSNTVDDIINGLCGDVKLKSDLADSEYDKLFIIKKTGRAMHLEISKYGEPSGAKP